MTRTQLGLLPTSQYLSQGMKLLLIFQYSDTWADPNQQVIQQPGVNSIIEDFSCSG